MRKRNESTLVTSCLRYLQTMENLKKIVHVDRLNSGRILVKRGIKWINIRLCREGTPDIYIILKKGEILWIECKSETGKQNIPQKEFENKVSGFMNHRYLLVKSVDELESYLKIYIGS